MAADAVLENIVSSLRASGVFEAVTLASHGASTPVPRAAVQLDRIETLPADDNSSSRWSRLLARIVIHTRCDDAATRLTRALELAAAARGALLGDPYRGQNCCDLPAGRATEIGPLEVNHRLKRPEIEISFTLRCHWETEEV